jgi:hypothetical protein
MGAPLRIAAFERILDHALRLEQVWTPAWARWCRPGVPAPRRTPGTERPMIELSQVSKTFRTGSQAAMHALHPTDLTRCPRAR